MYPGVRDIYFCAGEVMANILSHCNVCSGCSICASEGLYLELGDSALVPVCHKIPLGRALHPQQSDPVLVRQAEGIYC